MALTKASGDLQTMALASAPSESKSRVTLLRSENSLPYQIRVFKLERWSAFISVGMQPTICSANGGHCDDGRLLCMAFCPAEYFKCLRNRQESGFGVSIGIAMRVHK